MTKGGLFSYLRAYLTNITPYKLFIRLFFVEKQKLVVHPHKNVQRVFFIYIGSFDTPSNLMRHYNISDGPDIFLIKDFSPQNVE